MGLFLFLLKVESRRNIKYRLGSSPAFLQNLRQIGQTFYRHTVFPDFLLHGDTLDYLLKGAEPHQLHGLRVLLVSSLLRKKCLEDFRLLTYYPISVDGTGALTFKTRHCVHCLTKTHQGKTLYYHPEP